MPIGVLVNVVVVIIGGLLGGLVGKYLSTDVKLTWINPRASICGSRRRAALGGRTNAPADTPSA